MSNGRNGKGFLMGVVLGGLVGGFATLLLAPKAGGEMRKDLHRKCRDVSKKTHDLMDSLSEEASDLVAKAKEMADKAKDAAQSVVEEYKSRRD